MRATSRRQSGRAERPAVAVYVNDGRHHLQMQPRPRKTSSPWSRRPSRTRRGCCIPVSSTRWPGRDSNRLASSASGCRPTGACRDGVGDGAGVCRVFPHAVLLSGRKPTCCSSARPDRMQIDQAADRSAGECAGGASRSLRRLDLGSAREDRRRVRRLGTDAGGGDKDSAPASDDRPFRIWREVLARLRRCDAGLHRRLRQVASWCPDCFADGGQFLLEGLDVYLASSPAPTRVAG